MNKEPTCNANFTSYFLNSLKPFFSFTQNKNFEVSWTLKPGVLDKKGRVNCWIESNATNDFHPITKILKQLHAPDTIKSAQQLLENPVIQGVGISSSGEDNTYRLYLHGRNPTTQKDFYEAYRWSAGEAVHQYKYFFHFISTKEETSKLEQLIHINLLPVFKAILSNNRLQQLSGYWLRYNNKNVIDQIYVSFPWQPLAGSLPGIAELLAIMQLEPAAVSEIMEFPVKHIAFKLRTPIPQVTLYTASATKDYWPDGEDGLQSFVLSSAKNINKGAEKLFASLPHLPARQDESEIGNFYNGSIDLWKKILGPKMHYHFGIFDDDVTDLQQALHNAVTSLYPLLPAGGRIYDIGCGWGGPLAMMVKDLNCQVLGLTSSFTQYQYVASLGYNVRLGNAEQTLPPGHFDCILLLESFCHILNKERLLTVLKFFSSRLVMRVSCQDNYPSGKVFGDSMLIISSDELRHLLEKTGWKIKHWKNVRKASLPSIRLWNDCVQAIPQTNDKHIETLRNWTANASIDPDAWGASNPLIEIMAEQ